MQDNRLLADIRGKLLSEEETLDLRLKAVLREKELLFSRLMDLEKEIEKVRT